MADRELIKQQLSATLAEIEVAGLGEKISGKVRDSYVIGDKRVLITSDRLSAFDVILTTIPFKGQLLNRMANFWFEKTKHIIPNHIIDTPHPNVFVAQQVEIVPIEVVIRGYLTGSAWRDYQAGKDVSGIKLPAGLKKSQKFDQPLLTPSTKAEIGDHDRPISKEEILSEGIVKPELWEEISQKAFELFAFGTAEAAKQGLILVDTKYEFGLLKDESGNQQLVLADEVHTQDSSRYWMADSYQARFEAGEDPDMFDKEFVRRMLMQEFNYMGDGEKPDIDDDFRILTAQKYIEVCERLTGEEFVPEVGEQKTAIEASLAKFS